jgi:ABC-type transport system involved in multi-copper enzyme maturation permease subunit
MTEASIRTISPLAGLARLAGPIFDKELRVASRRRRTYLLRFVYVAFLTLFVVQVLAVSVRMPGSGSTALQVSQMGFMALRVVSTIVWFQFLLAQLLAIVLLSGAIGNEIRHGRLDALLVTPISDLQIVVGKLLSGLLQLILLLAVSLPLLAVVRVFGGVPWDYVTSSLCVTLTAALFTGSLSLLLSATNRHAYRVVTNAIGWCLVLWGGSAGLLALLRWVGYISSAMVEHVLYLTNPFVVMGTQTRSMLAASTRLSPLVLTHCLAMVGGAALMLLLAVWRIRRVALAPVPGQGPTSGRGAVTPETPGLLGAWWPWSRAIRRVTGSPITWKELRRPIFPRGRRGVVNALGLIVAGCLIIGLLVFLVISTPMTVAHMCVGAVGLLQLLFIINVATGSASAITREKEAQTLPILLTVPLSGRAIIRGKALGLLYRNLLLLAPLPLLLIVGYMLAPRAFRITGGAAATVTLLEIAAASDVVFVLGLGLCLSVYLRTTTPAVVATFVLYVTSKVFSRLFGGLILMGALRASMGRPDTILLGLVASGLHVVVYGGLGVLLGAVAAAGLRRNCT